MINFAKPAILNRFLPSIYVITNMFSLTELALDRSMKPLVFGQCLSSLRMVSVKIVIRCCGYFCRKFRYARMNDCAIILHTVYIKNIYIYGNVIEYI